MLETISETKSFKAPLPPRILGQGAVIRQLSSKELHKLLFQPSIHSSTKTLGTMKPVQTKSFVPGKYGDDQDPSFTDRGGEEYARSYYSLQTRKLAEAASPKGGTSPSSTAGSEQSDSFVCDMTSASEPLYGDPGEEESYQY